MAVRSPFASPDLVSEAVRVGQPIECRAAASAEELALHHEIRHQVFVTEQQFFAATDRDEHDDDPGTVHILGLCGQVAAGAVRLYPLEEPGWWKGDRLAVLPAFRSHGLGGPLVRFAVETAGRAGGSRMMAHIQPANVRFFEHLGWQCVGEPVDYVGQLHQLMEIGLRSGPEAAIL
ncbi:MAG TPA: MSMEG_0567/Sll0786 family nitrogen starvation N-acetyltransferase [Actinomycetota bacterium]|nr:MSMEG_0567/Sll0786 family nitrogen starvation N-acetyltransferase [Actinomycetota bacterium]